MKYRPAIGSTERARALRTNATDPEKAMWRLLRESFSEARFRRQVPLRHYIVDSRAIERVSSSSVTEDSTMTKSMRTERR